MTALAVAVIQMTSGAEQSRNLAEAARLIEAAAGSGAELIVLPENFSAMSLDDADRCTLAEADGDGPVQAFLAEQAAGHRAWIVGGTLPIRGDDPQRPYASALVYGADGKRVARYDKMHLFDVDVPERDEHYRESKHTAAGSTPLLVSSPWGRLCVAVCYDVRFAELFRQFDAAPDLIALPAAFTVPTGAAHWSVLVRARAIENLCPVLAAAQTGRHENGRRTWGHSLIVDAWGDVLADAGTAPGVRVATLDPVAAATVRRRFPSLEHRRL